MIGFSAVAATVVLQPDGRIVVAGDSIPGTPRPPPPPPPAPPAPPPPTPPPERIVLARYYPDGNLDQSFGSGGVITASIGRRLTRLRPRLQPDGRILVAGSSDARSVVARYSPEGLLDTGFGSPGSSWGRPSRPAYLSSALVLQPDGKIVVGGSNTLRSATCRTEARPAFGPNGIATDCARRKCPRAATGRPNPGRGVQPSRRPERFTLSRFLTSFPTTIKARSRTLPFGQTTKVGGTLTPVRIGVA